MADARRNESLSKFQQKLQEHRQLEANLKQIREKTQELEKAYNKSEDDLKALQSVGQVKCSLRKYDFNFEDYWRGFATAFGGEIYRESI
jgi:hypothetical protein